MQARNAIVQIMTSFLPDMIVPSRVVDGRQFSNVWLLPISILAMLLIPSTASAFFHLWTVTEVYSSGDGSVQFVKLATGSGSQNSLGGQVITCTGPQGMHSFTFPTNLPSSVSTANMTFLI